MPYKIFKSYIERLEYGIFSSISTVAVKVLISENDKAIFTIFGLQSAAADRNFHIVQLELLVLNTIIGQGEIYVASEWSDTNFKFQLTRQGTSKPN